MREPITTAITLVILVAVGAGVASVPDVLMVVESMYLSREVFADRHEHALAVRLKTCTAIARACGVRLETL